MFERKFVTLGRLLQHWELIVGKDLALITTPVKLTYQKKAKKKVLGLVIAADSSQAMRLHYRKELIIAKINQILGDIEISDLKFVDQAIKASPEHKRDTKTQLSDKQKEDLAGILSDMDDQELKKSLKSFGESIFVKSGHANQDE